MDRELPAEIVRKARIRKYAVIGVSVLILVSGFLFLRAVISPSLDWSRIRTSIAEIGVIEATVSASGVVVPEFEQVITSPIVSTVESIRVRSGDSVEAGESILQLDTAQLQLTYEKAADELEIQKNKKRQLALELDRKKTDLQASYDIKALQTRFAETKYERAKHLHDIGGATQEDLDLAALDLEIARRESEQLARQIENQRAAIEAVLDELDLQISVQQNKLNETQRELDLCEARAGLDGTVTWVNDDIGAPVSSGDIVARVADLSSFKVEARISDVHAGKLRIGGPVTVRIGDTDLRGDISSIRPAVQEGIVTFVVQLDDNSHRVLRPNLRADVFVVTSFKDRVVRVKNGPFYNGSVDQRVYVIRGNKAVGKIVDIGVSNFDWVELQGDISAGDEVVISNMDDYRHMDEISITGNK